MSCKHCGAPVRVGAKFCENCGNKVETDDIKEKNDVLTEEVKEEKIERVYDADADSTSSYKEPESPLGGFAEESPKKPASSGDGPIGYSIASLVCGILGILCCSCCGLGLVFSIAGITLGIISLNKNCEGRGLAIAGIACGGVGVLFGLPIIIGGISSGVSSASDITDLFSDFIDSL